RARSDMDVAQHRVVLRTFMRHYAGDTTRADNEYIFFHSSCSVHDSGIDGGCLAGSSAQAIHIVLISKFLYDTYTAIELLDRDSRHFHAVEPVFLDHGVARRIAQRHPGPWHQGLGKIELAEHIARQAGIAADQIAVRPDTGLDARRQS